MTLAPLSGAFGGLLASGILKLSHFGSLHSWQMYVIAAQCYAAADMI